METIQGPNQNKKASRGTRAQICECKCDRLWVQFRFQILNYENKYICIYISKFLYIPFGRNYSQAHIKPTNKT